MGIASAEIEKFDKHTLKLIGASLYFAEGGKNSNRADFTNSNADMVKRYEETGCHLGQFRLKSRT